MTLRLGAKSVGRVLENEDLYPVFFIPPEQVPCGKHQLDGLPFHYVATWDMEPWKRECPTQCEDRAHAIVGTELKLWCFSGICDHHKKEVTNEICETCPHRKWRG